MNPAIRLLPLAVAVVLTACASSGPVAPDSSNAATAASAAPATGRMSPQALGYKRTVIDGQEYFCKTERVTGTRARTQETCLTQADLQRKQEDSDYFLRRTQDQGAVAPPPTAGSEP